MKKILVVVFAFAALATISACGGSSGSGGNGDTPTASWTTSDVDTSGNTGIDPAIAVDALGNPFICYYDQTNADLKYAYLSDGTWVTEAVISEGNVGEECGIAVDGGGGVHISSNSGSTTNILRYATRPADGSWSFQSFEQPDDYHVTSTSIALDSGGNPHIVYNIQENDDSVAAVEYKVRYKYYDGSAWQDENIAEQGQDVFLAIDSADNSHVSMRVEDPDAGNDVYRLTYAKRAVGAWTLTTLDEDTDAGGDTGIAVDSGGNPHIAYRDYGNGAVKYAYNDGGSWSYSVVDASAGSQEGTKIAVDSAGAPHIVYVDEGSGDTENLEYAVLAGGSWSFETIDRMGNPAIAIDSSDIPHVAHNRSRDDDTEYLRYSVRE